MAQDSESVLFLDKNRIFVYDGNGITKLDIPTTIIRDIDVVDKSGLDSLLDTLIKSKKLAPGKLWIILSDTICFSRDFTEVDPVKLEVQIKDFLEAVPFDQIVSKKYRSQTGVRIIASNYEFLEAVGEIFERDGFGVEGIIPSAIFPGYNTKKILDSDFAKYILASRNVMRQGNMLQKVEAPKPAVTETTEPKKKSTLLPYLLIGFGVLIAILIAVLFIRMRR